MTGTVKAWLAAAQARAMRQQRPERVTRVSQLPADLQEFIKDTGIDPKRVGLEP